MAEYISFDMLLELSKDVFHYGHYDLYDLEPFLDDIRKYAVDFAEVKHGEWRTGKSIHNEEYYVCSACVSATDDIYRYCPNCGADMRGK